MGQTLLNQLQHLPAGQKLVIALLGESQALLNQLEHLPAEKQNSSGILDETGVPVQSPTRV